MEGGSLARGGPKDFSLGKLKESSKNQFRESRGRDPLEERH